MLLLNTRSDAHHRGRSAGLHTQTPAYGSLSAWGHVFKQALQIAPNPLVPISNRPRTAATRPFGFRKANCLAARYLGSDALRLCPLDA